MTLPRITAAQLVPVDKCTGTGSNSQVMSEENDRPEADVSGIIANEFIGFNAGQWIVDIPASDVGFSTDGECGTWFNTPRAGSLTSIPPGRWLVGAQVNPGTYVATTRAGCYWERLRNFSASLGGIHRKRFCFGRWIQNRFGRF